MAECASPNTILKVSAYYVKNKFFFDSSTIVWNLLWKKGRVARCNAFIFVSIFTSGNSAYLGHPRAGLSIWLSLLAIFNTLFWVYADFFFLRENENTKILEVRHFCMIQKWPPTVTRRDQLLVALVTHWSQFRALYIHFISSLKHSHLLTRKSHFRVASLIK